ncbi:MAG: outer membrane beta-barrel family protein, partial [Bacteroidota bacterium]
FGAGYRTLPNTQRRSNQFINSGTTVTSEGEVDKNETFLNLILGMDYHFNATNVLTLSGRFAYEWEDEFSQQDFLRNTTDGGAADDWRRDETTEAVNPKWHYELHYQRQLKSPDDRDHTLMISALGDGFLKDQSSEFLTTTREGQAAFGDQQTRTDFGQKGYVFGLDYTRPVGQKGSLEAGLQYDRDDTGNDFVVLNRLNESFELDPNQTNDFRFDQGVIAAYATFGLEGKQWGWKAGLRAEGTQVNTLLVTTNVASKRWYRNLFPSGHVSYKVNSGLSFQLGYSRRIYRPGLWELNPFFNLRDNFNVETGNPDLRPELTDGGELTGIWTGDKANLSVSVYHRRTTGAIEDFIFLENGINVNRPLNLGIQEVSGLEINAKAFLTESLTVSTDRNGRRESRRATVADQVFDFSTLPWRARLNAKLQLPAGLDVEASGHYRSGFALTQGQFFDTGWVDAGLRKKLSGGKWVVSLSVRDLFASRRFQSTRESADFLQFGTSRRGRFLLVGVSYAFGDGEAMEFGGAKQL